MTDNEEIVSNEEEVIEEQEVQETPEQELERLRAEKAEYDRLKEKHQQILNDQSQLGRRYKELQGSQQTVSQELASLKAMVEGLKTPPVDSEGEYLDMTNPAVAQKWFEQQAADYVRKQDALQTAYETKYEQNVKDLLEENEDMSAEERKAIMDLLHTQKDNMFNDPLRDAQWNIEKAQLKYLRNLKSGKKVSNPNIKQEKAVGTGVGGSGTTSGSPSNRKQESPEIQRLRNIMEKANSMRGW